MKISYQQIFTSETGGSGPIAIQIPKVLGKTGSQISIPLLGRWPAR